MPEEEKQILPVVEPVYGRESVNVVLATDQNYLPYVAVVLYSLKAHANKNKKYDICILNDGKLNLEDFPREKVTAENISVRFITLNLDQYPYDFAAHLTGRYTTATYYRFFIGEVFRRYEKILYLDSDIIILDDVAKLYEINLEGKIFAGGNDRCQFLPTDKQTRDYITRNLGVNFSDYFCAGVMLMNIEKMRMVRLLGKALQRLDELGHPGLVDQDVLNSLFAGETMKLPECWNVMWSVFLYGDEETVARYEKLALPAKIIHYDSKCKPWNEPKKRLADEWWRYARELEAK